MCPDEEAHAVCKRRPASGEELQAQVEGERGALRREEVQGEVQGEVRSADGEVGCGCHSRSTGNVVTSWSHRFACVSATKRLIARLTSAGSARQDLAPP